MRVAVIGTGYVGLVSGACLAEVGHEVACVDIDAAKVAAINGARSPIHERGLDDLLRRNVPARLSATTDLAAAVAGAAVTLITVGTPFDGSQIDLEQVRAAALAIGRAVRGRDGYHLVVVKSTVVPGTTDGLVRAALEEGSGKRCGEDFGLGMNPEFLREGEAVEDFMNPDRIVLGGVDERSLDVLAELYRPFPGVPLIRTSTRTAEMIKYASNALLATLISFSNEIGNLCAAVGGVDVVDVMRAVHLDRRVSPVLPGGARVVPGLTTYLEAGCGFGGSCFPKDVSAFVAYAERHGAPLRVLRGVLDVNRDQPSRVLDLLARHLPDLRGRRVAVLGLAFKPGTDDVRESPAIEVVRKLLELGADVRAYDPVAAKEAERVLGGAGIRYTAGMAEAVDGAEAVLLLTRWEEFAGLPALLAGRSPAPPVVDGRRMLPPDAVPLYEGIGR